MTEKGPKNVDQIINPIKPRGGGWISPPSSFLSVDFYQVHLQHWNFLTFSFYLCYDVKLIFWKNQIHSRG